MRSTLDPGPSTLRVVCDVCGAGRPEHLVATIRHDLSAQFDLPPGTVERTVMHCCDHGECIEAAEEPENWWILNTDGTRVTLAEALASDDDVSFGNWMG